MAFHVLRKYYLHYLDVIQSKLLLYNVQQSCTTLAIALSNFESNETLIPFY